MWIFLTLILVTIVILLYRYSSTGDGWQGLAGMWCVFLIVVIVTIIEEHILEPEPTALDVYRGSTELKIISVNGVPSDTIVVFKNN